MLGGCFGFLELGGDDTGVHEVEERGYSFTPFFTTSVFSGGVTHNPGSPYEHGQTGKDVGEIVGQRGEVDLARGGSGRP